MRRRAGRAKKTGVRKVNVPNLSGLTRSQAQAALSAVGLVYSESTTNTSDSGLTNYIQSQGTSSGSTVLIGASIPFVYYNYVAPYHAPYHAPYYAPPYHAPYYAPPYHEPYHAPYHAPVYHEPYHAPYHAPVYHEPYHAPYHAPVYHEPYHAPYHEPYHAPYHAPSPNCSDCGSQGCTNQCCVPCGGISSGGQCIVC